MGISRLTALTIQANPDQIEASYHVDSEANPSRYGLWIGITEELRSGGKRGRTLLTGPLAYETAGEATSAAQQVVEEIKAANVA